MSKIKYFLFFLFIFSGNAFASPIGTPVEYKWKESLEERETLNERISRVEENIKSMEKAITVAFSSINERLLGMNEFRSTLKDQQATYITRAELWGYFIGLSGIIFAVITLLKK